LQKYATPGSGLVKRLSGTHLLCRGLERAALPFRQLSGPHVEALVRCHACLVTASKAAKKITTPG
jgi:hypothetical protein